jgi:N-acetylglucosaminyl-diphospho-decaprenol L-rhamnosyltransferase
MNATGDRVMAIVVTFNSGHCIAPLAGCLQALPQIMIVDNASADDTCARVAQHLPHARWLPLAQNLGFGVANNRGLAEATTEFVLLLNPDCIVAPGAVEALIACADRFPEAAAVAPQLVDRQGRPDISYRWRSDQWSSSGPGADGPACVGFASGACLLIRSDSMRRVGGFDEDFFLYYEDDDLCIRLQQHCGALVLEPAARVQHFSRGSVGGKQRFHAEYLRGLHHIQSKFRFRRKHLGRRAGAAQRLGYGLGAAAETLLRLLLLDPRRAARSAGRVAGVLGYRG